MLDCQIYGLNARGHHLTNVLLHAAAAVFLFLALRRMTRALWPSAWVAAVFALHPLRVESVAWVAERKDVLSGLLLMLILWFYARYAERPASWGRYLLVVATFALGLTAKPMLVTLPFVLLLLDYWPLGRAGSRERGAGKAEGREQGAGSGEQGAGEAGGREQGAGSREDTKHSLVDRGSMDGGLQISDRRLPVHPPRSLLPAPCPLLSLVLEKLPLFALAAASCLVTLAAQGDALASTERLPIPWRMSNAAVSYIAYLGKVFYPAGLASPLSFSQSRTPCLGSGCCGYDPAGDFCGRLRGSAEVSLLARRVAVVPWNPVAGERVGAGGQPGHGRSLHILAADRALCCDRLGRDPRGRRLALPSRGLCGPFGAASRRVDDLRLAAGAELRDSKALWTHTLACTGQNATAYYGLGSALADRGEDDKAIAEYDKALSIKPDFARAHDSLGLALVNRNQVDKAITHYQRALELDPDYAEAYNDLGIALAGRGLIDKAIAQFRRAVEIKPDYAEAHNNLGNALASRDRVDEAVVQYLASLEIDPDNAKAHNNLGAALTRRGQVDEAITHCRKALEIKPDYLEAHANLADALAKRGSIHEAIDQYQQALDVAIAGNNARPAAVIRDRIRQLQAVAPARESP